MGGLKEHQFCESDEFFREYPGPLSNETHLYYLKSEADKVIAYHKYKRCLAMAKWCDEVMMSCELRGYAINYIWFNRHQLAMRWKYRWLELAEKFKPNNSTAQ